MPDPATQVLYLNRFEFIVFAEDSGVRQGLLQSQPPNVKPLKWSPDSSCMDQHFPLESCHWAANMSVNKVRFMRISWVGNFLENLVSSHVPIVVTF